VTLLVPVCRAVYWLSYFIDWSSLVGMLSPSFCPCFWWHILTSRQRVITIVVVFLSWGEFLLLLAQSCVLEPRVLTSPLSLVTSSSLLVFISPLPLPMVLTELLLPRVKNLFWPCGNHSVIISQSWIGEIFFLRSFLIRLSVMPHSYFCSTPKCFSLAASCAGSCPAFVFAVYFIDADLSCLPCTTQAYICVVW